MAHLLLLSAEIIGDEVCTLGLALDAGGGSANISLYVNRRPEWAEESQFAPSRYHDGGAGSGFIPLSQ